VSDLRALIREELRLFSESTTLRAADTGGLLQLKDAAKRLNQSESWVYRHWKEVGGKKLGGNIRFSRDDLEKFISKRGA
jgi:Helix-turn-helix domain